MITVAIIQARMGSSRLPGKVLMDLAGRSVLAHVVEAAHLIAGVDKVVVATSSHIGDDALAAWCDDHDVACFRGSETDVLDRFVGAACAHDASIVIRLTADCPLLDPEIAGQVLALLIAGGVDYASNIDPASWPDGLDCEAMTMAALVSAAADATRSSDREHVTPFIRNSKERYTSLNLICPIPGLGCHRWTLDTADDFTFLANLMAELPGDRAVSMTAVLALLRSRPELGRRPDGVEGGRRRSGPPSRAVARTPFCARIARNFVGSLRRSGGLRFPPQRVVGSSTLKPRTRHALLVA